MATVRVASAKRSRLVRVTLEKVPLESRHGRLDHVRRIRDERWEAELRPDFGYSPTMRQRMDALHEAIDLMRAAVAPTATHLISEEAVAEQVRLGRYEP